MSLTDEELAEMVGRDRLFGEGRIVGQAAADRRRLIAEVERLREQAAQYRQWVVDANRFAYEATLGGDA